MVANGFVFAPLPSQGRAPPRTVRRAEDEKSDERPTGERLAPVEETLSAFVVGAVAAAGAGVEILDAGAVSSALLAGALVGFAAENENQYGFGMLARGLVRSRRPAALRLPSRHRGDSCPSDEAVGGFFFEFEAVRAETAMLRAGAGDEGDGAETETPRPREVREHVYGLVVGASISEGIALGSRAHGRARYFATSRRGSAAVLLRTFSTTTFSARVRRRPGAACFTTETRAAVADTSLSVESAVCRL